MKNQRAKDLEIEEKLCECTQEKIKEDELKNATIFLSSKKMKRIRLAMKDFVWRLVRLKLTPWEVPSFLFSLIFLGP